MTATERAHKLFNIPAPMSRMDRISSEALLIIEDQNARRTALTEKLRTMRLARDAQPPEPSLPVAKKKAARAK